MVRYSPSFYNRSLHTSLSSVQFPARRVAAVAISLLLTGISALPAAAVSVVRVPGMPQPISQADRLPRSVARQVRQDLANRLGVPRSSLQIVGHSRQTWSDSCLGLGGPAESCLQALVDGWHVQVSDGEQTWIYRTDLTGQALRLEDQGMSEGMPDALRDRILETAAADTGIPVQQLAIAHAAERVWNGCFGFDEDVCTQIAIPGWQVIVTDQEGSWVYHTDNTGSEIRLNETASLAESGIIPDFVPSAELPQQMGLNVIFRSITSGGFTGQAYETFLIADGRVMRLTLGPDRNVALPAVINRISPQQVQEFEQLLRQQQFGNLDRLYYPASAGAADYRTVTLTANGHTTQYDDLLQDQLPAALQEVAQTWNGITGGV